MQALIVIDVQNDFIDGALGTREAQQMLPRLIEKAERFEGALLLTQDTHGADYLATQEGKYLPVPHCIEDSEGWRFPAPLEALRQARGAAVFRKGAFGSPALAEALRAQYEAGTLEAVELVGLCTDICVVSNALLIKAAMPELPVYVDAACCAGVTPEKHQAALDVMESCQIIVRR